MSNAYLVPALQQGEKNWRVDICSGSRKTGSFKAVPVTKSIYPTLKDADLFCRISNPKDFLHLLS